MSHLDSPLEMQFAEERRQMGMEQAKAAAKLGPRGMDGFNAITDGYFEEGKGFKDGFVKVNRDTGPVKGDADGDGKLSMAERMDADGDGKISAEEFARGLEKLDGDTAGHYEEAHHAARSVGVSAAEREQWAALRAHRQQGVYVPPSKARAEATSPPKVFDRQLGGWVAPDGAGRARPAPESSDQRTREQNAVKPTGNRNVRPQGYTPPPPVNPFDSRFNYQVRARGTRSNLSPCPSPCPPLPAPSFHLSITLITLNAYPRSLPSPPQKT